MNGMRGGKEMEDLDRQIDGRLQSTAGASQEIAELAAIARELRLRISPSAPRAAFATASPERLLRRLHAGGGEERRRIALRRLRWAPWIAAVGFALVLGPVGLVYAADPALPGDRLYGIKRGFEAFQLAVSMSLAGDAQLLATHTDERFTEVLALIETDRVSDLIWAAREYDLAVADLVEASRGIHDKRWTALLKHHAEILEAIRATAPAQALPGLDTALESSTHGAEVLQALEQGISPSELAPGQLKKTEAAPQIPPGLLPDGPGNGLGPPDQPGGQGNDKKDAPPSP